jgi:transcriptional regulator with XRE-family HTH domain
MARQPSRPNPIIGKTIQYLMTSQAGLHSQPLLAKKSGVSQSTIGRIIRGEVNPSADNIKRIADALGVDVTSLYVDLDALGLTEVRQERMRSLETRFVHRKSGKTFLEWDLHVKEDSERGRRIELKESVRKGFVIGEVDDGYAVQMLDDIDDRGRAYGAFLLVERAGTPAYRDLCLVRMKDGATFIHEFQSSDDPDDYFFNSMLGQSITVPQAQVEWIHGVVAIASSRQWRPR